MDATEKQISFILALAAKTHPEGTYVRVSDLDRHPAALGLSQRDRRDLSKAKASKIIDELQHFERVARNQAEEDQARADAAEREALGLSPFARLPHQELPAPAPARRRAVSSTASSTANATPKQIALITRLARTNPVPGGVMTSTGRVAIPANLYALTRREASDLINTLTDHEM